MNPIRNSQRVRVLFNRYGFGLLGVSVLACSALLANDSKQCNAAADCDKLGRGPWICEVPAGVCASAPASEGGGAGIAGTDTAASGGMTMDGAPDAGSVGIGIGGMGSGGTGSVSGPAVDTRGRVLSYSGAGALRGINSANGTLNDGHQFEVTEDGLSIVDLGVWDQGADGLSGPHTVTLFSIDKAGAGAGASAKPITGGSVIVPAGVAVPFDGGFRFAPLSAPIDLKPGTYAVVAYGLNAPDPYGDGGNVPLAGTGIRDLRFNPSEFSSNQSPAYPASGGTGSICSVSFHFKSSHDKFVKIMPLGDSMTEGQGSSGGYRLPLAGLLAEHQVAFQFVGSVATNPGTLSPDQVHHEGHTGAMIAAANARPGIDGSLGAYLGPGGVTPDFILLMIGTVDMDLPYLPETAPDRMDSLMTHILDKSAGLAPLAHLIVAQLPPNKDSAADARVVTYNAALAALVNRHKAAGENVSVVDMHAILGPDDFFDRLSPNDAGYAKMARVWVNAILQP